MPARNISQNTEQVGEGDDQEPWDGGIDHTK